MKYRIVSSHPDSVRLSTEFNTYMEAYDCARASGFSGYFILRAPEQDQCKDEVSRLAQFDAAIQKVTQERGAVYAPPEIDFARTNKIKEALSECKDPLARHALEMIAVKMARLTETPDHLDSWIDIAGYARCGVMVTEKPTQS